MTTAELLLAQYQGDMAHARRVANLSLTIFDESEPLHDLNGRARALLEVGALLHNVAFTIKESKHHTLGRDIILNTALDGLDDDERAVIACLVAFHRKRVQPELEPAYLRLGKQNRTLTLKLAAIVRVADGLDSSQSQSTQIVGVELSRPNLLLTLGGAHAAEDAERAREKADLWRIVFGGQLLCKVVQVPIVEAPMVDGAAPHEELPPGPLALAPATDEPAPPLLLEEEPWRLSADDTLLAALRKVLRRYFYKLLACEARIHEREEAEDIHQLRVATRRLRATFQTLGATVAPEQSTDFRRKLRDIAQTAGAVRDRDVFLEHLASYADAQGNGSYVGLEPLIAALQREQQRARGRLLEQFEARRYQRFKTACAAFLTATDSPVAPDEGPERRVRYAAGSAIWQRYEELRAYETLVPVREPALAGVDMTVLHQMRIAGKHLRYTLELFEDALGPRLKQVLDPLVEMQGHLGALQDIEVAVEYARGLPTGSEGIERYIAARLAEHNRLLGELPRYWEKVASATFRRRLMELIVKL